jgi:hypothetical protein
MKVKELIEKLKELPEELPVVLCNLNYDGDGDGEVVLPEIRSIELIPMDAEVGPSEDCVSINFEQ